MEGAERHLGRPLSVLTNVVGFSYMTSTDEFLEATQPFEGNSNILVKGKDDVPDLPKRLQVEDNEYVRVMTVTRPAKEPLPDIAYVTYKIVVSLLAVVEPEEASMVKEALHSSEASDENVYFRKDSNCNPKGQVVYQWIVFRRFREFRELYESMLTYSPEVPPCPNRSIVRKFDPGHLEERRRQLSRWLQRVTERRDLVSISEFRSFVDLYDHIAFFPPLASLLAPAPAGFPSAARRQAVQLLYPSGEDGSCDPRQIAEISEPSFGIRGVACDLPRGILLAGSCDFNPATRVDAFLSNAIRFPWEPKDAPPVWSGRISLWMRTKEPPPLMSVPVTHPSLPVILLSSMKKREAEMSKAPSEERNPSQPLPAVRDDAEPPKTEDEIPFRAAFESFRLLWFEAVACQVTCVHHSRLLQFIFIGLEDGRIFHLPLQGLEESRKKDHSLTQDLQQHCSKLSNYLLSPQLAPLGLLPRHTGRISGLYFEELRGLLYSASRDNCLKVYSVRSHRLLFEYKARAGIRSLEVFCPNINHPSLVVLALEDGGVTVLEHQPQGLSEAVHYHGRANGAHRIPQFDSRFLSPHQTWIKCSALSGGFISEATDRSEDVTRIDVETALLLTGDNDGTVAVWQLRMPDAAAKEDDIAISKTSALETRVMEAGLSGASATPLLYPNTTTGGGTSCSSLKLLGYVSRAVHRDVTALVYNPHSREIFVGGRTGTITTLNVDTGDRLFTFKAQLDGAGISRGVMELQIFDVMDNSPSTANEMSQEACPRRILLVGTRDGSIRYYEIPFSQRPSQTALENLRLAVWRENRTAMEANVAAASKNPIVAAIISTEDQETSSARFTLPSSIEEAMSIGKEHQSITKDQTKGYISFDDKRSASDDDLRTWSMSSNQV